MSELKRWAETKVTTLRWMFCFPVAMLVSCVLWMFASSTPHSTYFGGGILNSAFGVAPLFLSALVPTLIFVVLGVLLSPSKERSVAFVFFALALLCSGGGMGMVEGYRDGILAFWFSSAAGLLAGAFLGLLIALRLQRPRKKEPNQPLQRNAGERPFCG